MAAELLAEPHGRVAMKAVHRFIIIISIIIIIIITCPISKFMKEDDKRVMLG